MKTENFTKRNLALMALAGAVATGLIWQVRRVRASNPRPDPPGKFGMVGITRGQTLRLNVVNLVTPPDPGRQVPPPCRVVLSFRDANGRPFTDSDGQVLRRTVEYRTESGSDRVVSETLNFAHDSNDLINTQALHWDRGRPARYERRRCEDLTNCSTSLVLFALRAHGGRDARGPSEKLEGSSAGKSSL